jgi:hypothetical protein
MPVVAHSPGTSLRERDVVVRQKADASTAAMSSAPTSTKRTAPTLTARPPG